MVLVAAVAASSQQARAAEKRVIIGLHDSGPVEQRMGEDAIARLVEMPLQHHGMIVRRWAVSAGPPPAEWLAEARGVVTWFGLSDPEPARVSWVRDWIQQEVLPRDVKLVIMNQRGLLAEDESGAVDEDAWASLLQNLGLEASGQWFGDPLLVTVDALEPGLTAYEAPTPGPRHLGPVAPTSPFKTWVRTTIPAEAMECAPVLTGPFGGIALAPHIMWTGSGIGDRRWHLNLFEYLAEALDLRGLPVPDPCVVSGRRAFFLQVDGDGFESLTTVRPGVMAAQVFLDDVIDQFQLPMTVSIIIAGVADDLRIASSLRRPGPVGSPDERIALAREILTRPQVEVASHGVLHPLKWHRALERDTPPRTVVWYDGLKGYGYSPEAEVSESAAFIDSLLEGSGRRCEVMLWTGNALPSESVLRVTRESSLGNVNGATYKYDASTNSVGYVPPLVRLEGDELQVYCGAGNENIYDGYFDRHPGAFRHVAETVRRTGYPRILKPSNIYVHFYGAEQQERLASLVDLIRECGVEAEVAPIHAGDYWRAARDAFTTAEVVREGPAAWRARAMGDCRTLRIDGETRHVDFAASESVVGARHLLGSLYITLSAPRAVVVLSESGPSKQPHLVHASFVLRNPVLTNDGARFRAASFAVREAAFGGFRPLSEVALTVDAEAQILQADAAGLVTFTLPPGDDPIQVVQR